MFCCVRLIHYIFVRLIHYIFLRHSTILCKNNQVSKIGSFSFSIVLSCVFISLLLVTVFIIYGKMGNNINVIVSILFDGENISFEARFVMYINSTNIPPIIIMNRIYENQNLLYVVPLIRHTIIVYIKSVSAIAIGCFIYVNINLVIDC